MLYERIQYENDLPFQVSFSNVNCEDYHKHKEMEIMLVLQGSARCTIHHLEYEMKKDDILIVDTQDLHRIHDGSDDLIMMTMYIDLEQFTDKYPNLDYTVFTCEDCTKDSVEKYQDLQNKTFLLKSQMAMMMFAFRNNSEDTNKHMQLVNEFIDILVKQFQGFFMEDMMFKANQGKTRGVNLERLYRIVKYIYMNYDKDITLRDVADLEHLSHYYVSHLIKDSTGLSFQNFINYIRVEHAEEYLVENEHTLTQISEFCGFSSPAYFNKCFKKWHGVTPSAYRKKVKRYQRTHAKPVDIEHAYKLLSSYMDDTAKLKHMQENKENTSEVVMADIQTQLMHLNDEGKKNALTYIKYLSSQSEFNNDRH